MMKNNTWRQVAYVVRFWDRHGNFNPEIETTNIKTVGRKYITLDTPQNPRFKIETGEEIAEYSDKRLIFPTLAEAEETVKRKIMLENLWRWLSFDGRNIAHQLSTEKLELLYKILIDEEIT